MNLSQLEVLFNILSFLCVLIVVLLGNCLSFPIYLGLMCKCFVFNMGYDTSHINSVLAKEEVGDKSEIILLTPKKRDKRQENAIEDIRNYLNSLDIKTDLEVFSVGNSFEEDFYQIGRLLRSIDKKIVLSLSGGPRDFLIPLTLAASTFSTDYISKTYFRSDITNELKEINLPYLNSNLNSSEKEILTLCGEEPLNISEIKEKSSYSSSTIYRTIKELKSKGMMDKISKNSDSMFKITYLGKQSLKK